MTCVTNHCLLPGSWSLAQKYLFKAERKRRRKLTWKRRKCTAVAFTDVVWLVYQYLGNRSTSAVYLSSSGLQPCRGSPLPMKIMIRGCSSVAGTLGRHAADTGSTPRCGEGFFFQSQLSLQTLSLIHI